MSSAALAAYRKARAIELALAGCTYDAIAHELDLANRGTAWRMVQDALKEWRFAAVDAYCEAELERLESAWDRRACCWARWLLVGWTSACSRLAG